MDIRIETRIRGKYYCENACFISEYTRKTQGNVLRVNFWIILVLNIKTIN